MKFKIIYGFLVLVSFSGISSMAHSVVTATQLGKVTVVGGHFVPDCREVVIRENSTGQSRVFRVREIPGGQDNIIAIALAAMMSNRDVKVHFDPAVTVCTTEPAVTGIEVF